MEEKLIKIHPSIDVIPKCPADHSVLTIENFSIPGMRSIIQTHCSQCGSAYLVDLPVSHAIWSPTTFNIDTAEIFSPQESPWFTNLLKETYQNQNHSDISPTVQIFSSYKRIILLNCIDYLYGHALLKLLNAQRYIDHCPNLGCCVLVQKSLSHLVPEGVAEIWEVPLSIKEGIQWYSSLDKWIHDKIRGYDECFLSPAYSHPSHNVYDLSRFVRNLPDITNDIGNKEPVISFNYRNDRLWGKSLENQQKNIQLLFNILSKIFPNLLFVIIGIGKEPLLPLHSKKILDLRTEVIDAQIDQRWLAFLRASDCTVGIHGSNMLLPSGLAKNTVSFLPKNRLGNFLQDILFPHQLSNIRDAFLKYRFLYGNDDLSNIIPLDVAELIKSLLALNERESFWFGQGESSQDEFQPTSEYLYSISNRAYIDKKANDSFLQNIYKIFVK